MAGAPMDGGPGGGSSTDGACEASCDTQAKACPASGGDYASGCKTLCASIPSACDASYGAYAACIDNGGWRCSMTATINGKPAPEAVASTVCQAETNAYVACFKVHTTRCMGASADGTCPSIPCACPGGTLMISGSNPDGAGACTCLDATTCKESSICK